MKWAIRIVGIATFIEDTNMKEIYRQNSLSPDQRTVLGRINLKIIVAEKYWMKLKAINEA